MDLHQNKLTRKEWNSLEQPVSDNEKIILNIIKKGFNEINIKYNNKQSLYSYIKVENNECIEYYLFKQYFDKEIQTIITKYGSNINYDNIFSFSKKIKKINSTDSLRLQNLDKNININKHKIFEFLLIELTHNLLKKNS